MTETTDEYRQQFEQKTLARTQRNVRENQSEQEEQAREAHTTQAAQARAESAPVRGGCCNVARSLPALWLRTSPLPVRQPVSRPRLPELRYRVKRQRLLELRDT